jgi:hypothetical protein
LLFRVNKESPSTPWGFNADYLKLQGFAVARVHNAGGMEGFSASLDARYRLADHLDGFQFLGGLLGDPDPWED